MKPLIIPSRFGEHYQVFAQWQTPVGSGELITTNDVAFLFSIITHELIMAAEDWRGALMRLGVSMPPNFFHAADIYHELVKLFQYRHLQLVKIPRLDRLPAIPTGNGWGYCFTRGPDRHPAGESPVALSSLRDAEIFFQSLKLNEKTLRLFSLNNPRIAGYLAAEQNLAQQFINGLAKQDILAYRVPAPSAAPPPKAVEYIAATAIEREVPLAPQAKDTPPAPSAEAKPQAPAHESAANAKVPPQSLDDCAVRLEEARVRLNTTGYKPKYTDEQQLQKVNENSVSKERFLVSFQTKNTDPDAKLAFQRDSGLAPVWATSFDQLENADTDPQLIADVLGTPYEPSKEYLLHIIDRGEDGTRFGQNTLVPTWDNMQKPTQKYLGGKHDPAVLAEVMTPEYQTQYAKDIEIYKGAGLNEFNKDDHKVFAKRLPVNDQAKFNARHNVRTEIGANSEFTGNGLTQSREGSTNYGVVETLTLENNPPPISRMSNVKTIELKPRGVV